MTGVVDDPPASGRAQDPRVFLLAAQVIHFQGGQP
jgi:hypothetical protein